MTFEEWFNQPGNFSRPVDKNLCRFIWGAAQLEARLAYEKKLEAISHAMAQLTPVTPVKGIEFPDPDPSVIVLGRRIEDAIASFKDDNINSQFSDAIQAWMRRCLAAVVGREL